MKSATLFWGGKKITQIRCCFTDEKLPFQHNLYLNFFYGNFFSLKYRVLYPKKLNLLESQYVYLDLPCNCKREKLLHYFSSFFLYGIFFSKEQSPCSSAQLSTYWSYATKLSTHQLLSHKADYIH